MGGSGTFYFGVLTHDGSDNALGTPRWVVQQKGWTGTGSGAVNNKNWTPGSKDVPVILGAIGMVPPRLPLLTVQHSKILVRLIRLTIKILDSELVR